MIFVVFEAVPFCLSLYHVYAAHDSVSCVFPLADGVLFPN